MTLARDSDPNPDPDAESVPARKPPVLASSAMPGRSAGIVRRAFAWLFGHIDYPAGKKELVHSLDERGIVVYIARAPSWGLALYFNHLLTRIGLPLPRFVGGINMWPFQPIGRYLKGGLRRRTDADAQWRERFGKAKPREAALANTILREEPAFLFLPRQRSRTQKGERTKYDFVRAMVAAQRLTERAVFLVPHAVTDQVVAGASRKTWGWRLFGDRRRQGRFRQLAMLISPTRQATVRVADEIDLKEYIAGHSDLDDDAIARRLRHELHTRISDEERVIAGPEMPDPDTIARHVLRGADLRQAIEAEVAAGNASLPQLERKATADLKHIAARYNVQLIRIADKLLHWVFNRIYDGIVVDEPGLARVIETSRKAPVVLCPSHRSHIDYLVLSYVMFRHGITPPHVAAGANLSFFPLGVIFRRGGAFFLRRTFKDDPVYAAVFRGYVGELLRLGAQIEFFPEGTRSRTGKTLMPRFGMYSMLVGAWRQGAQEDVQFVPVSIDYDRIIEASSYEKELGGAEKKSENVSGLLKSTGVLRSRYGRVHLQFGQPVPLSSLVDEFELPQTTEPAHDDRARALVEKLGYRINHDIARLSTVTPTSVIATALLSHRGRGVSEERLMRLAHAIVEFLDDYAARLSESLLDSERREAPLREAIEGLVDDGMVVAERAGKSDGEAIFRVPEEKRILLDYHKNALMNHFAPAALVARSMVRHGHQSVAREALAQDVKFMSRLFKREFLFRADSGFDIYLEDVVASLALLGIVDFDDDAGTVSALDPERVDVLAGLIDSLLESYAVTIRAVADLEETPLPEKELKDRALERVRRAFLEGEISRPEAANQTVVGSAVGWLKNERYLEADGDARRGALRSVDSAGLKTLQEQLAPLLKR